MTTRGQLTREACRRRERHRERYVAVLRELQNSDTQERLPTSTFASCQTTYWLWTAVGETRLHHRNADPDREVQQLDKTEEMTHGERNVTWDKAVYRSAETRADGHPREAHARDGHVGDEI